jgi:hypothetical protein
MLAQHIANKTDITVFNDHLSSLSPEQIELIDTYLIVGK